MSEPVRFRGVAYNLLTDVNETMTKDEYYELQGKIEYDKEYVVKHPKARISKKRLNVDELVGLPVLYDHSGPVIGKVVSAHVKGNDIKVAGEIHDNAFKSLVRNKDIDGLSLKFCHILENGKHMIKYKELSITKNPFLNDCTIELALSKNLKKKAQHMAEATPPPSTMDEPQQEGTEQTPQQPTPQTTPQQPNQQPNQQNKQGKFNAYNDYAKRKIDQIEKFTHDELMKHALDLELAIHTNTLSKIQSYEREFKELDLTEIESATLIDTCSTSPTLFGIIEKFIQDRREKSKSQSSAAQQPAQPTQPTQQPQTKPATKSSVGATGINHQPKTSQPPTLAQTQRDASVGIPLALSKKSTFEDVVEKHGIRLTTNFDEMLDILRPKPVDDYHHSPYGYYKRQNKY